MACSEEKCQEGHEGSHGAAHRGQAECYAETTSPRNLCALCGSAINNGTFAPFCSVPRHVGEKHVAIEDVVALADGLSDGLAEGVEVEPLAALLALRGDAAGDGGALHRAEEVAVEEDEGERLLHFLP